MTPRLKLTTALATAAAACVLAPRTVRAATISVGPGDDYAKIEAAGPGDVVEIQPGTYKFRVYLDKQGNASAPIVIRAADPNNRPVWDLAGQSVENWPGSYTGGDRGRGCWQISGAHYQISGIVFRNCHTASSGNAAGIRTIASESVVVRDALFESNDAGFTGDGENTAVEFSEFVGNGNVTNPPQHSMYIFGGSFALRYSYVHDSVGGQNLHIRARDSVIEYNWIARAANYEGDMMPGNDPQHAMLLRGNVIVGNPSPGNGGQVIVLYNDSGSSGITMKLTAVYNTFVLRSGTNPALLNVRNDTIASAEIVFSNNIVVGTDTAYSAGAPGNSNLSVAGRNNWFQTGADVGVLAASIFGSAPGFQNGAALDLRLASGSAAIGAADASVADAPNREYFENETNSMKFRWRASVLDLGAFESTTTGAGFGPYDAPTPPDGGSGAGGTGGGSGSGGGSGNGGSSGVGASSSGGSSAVGGSTSGGGSGATAGSSSGGKAGNSSGGKAGSSSAATSSGDDSGCGCRVAAPRGAAWLSAIAIGALLLRRRRPRA